MATNALSYRFMFYLFFCVKDDNKQIIPYLKNSGSWRTNIYRIRRKIISVKGFTSPDGYPWFG
jgi:hypothetical protein